MSFNPALLRQQFPLLSEIANGYPLVYLDNAATTQKPDSVLNALIHYYRTSNANVHRGSHFLSNKATDQFEQARKTVAQFIQAPNNSHIIWSKGTTEAINLVAYGIENQLQTDDEILISNLEHHANLVPWQQLANRTGARLVVLPFQHNKGWQEEFTHYFSNKTKLVACTQISNALGITLPIKKIINLAKSVGALTLIDGAQAVAHLPVNVSELDCDFYVFSGHKMYGPTGIGALYGKTTALELLEPYQTGGEMVQSVRYETTLFNELPYRLEAGTPNIEGAIGLAAACDFLTSQDRQALLDWEYYLCQRAYQALDKRQDIQIYSPAHSTLLSFTVKTVNTIDLNDFLDSKGIAVRSGQHCAHPLMDELGIAGTVRASFACYNTEAEVDSFLAALFEAIDLLSED